jgi:uncharacterized protein YqeY
MNIKEQIDQDLKAALLAGDKTLTTTLRGLKSAILYVEVAAGKREEGLDTQALIALLRKEAKKRQESATMYKQGDSQDRADAELNELAIIEKYLPKQMSDDALTRLVDQAISETGELSPQIMGQVIARVKELSEGAADGGRIAAVVKQRMDQ